MEMNGILSMTAEQYHAADGVSKSSLDWIAPPYTPAHFHARFIANTLADEETPAKRLGSLTHRVILEPDTLDGAFYVKPEGMTFTTKEGKAWRDDHSDRPIIANDDATAIKGMRDAVWRHPLSKRLLTGAAKEQNLFATDATGVLRKGRIDVLKSGWPIADLKTVAGTDDKWFERQNEECRWYVQAAYYVDLAELVELDCQRAFCCITVEKTPPYDVTCRDFNDLLEAGRMCYKRDLALLNHCRESDQWPGRSIEFLPASLPAWVMKQLEAIS